MSPRGPGLTAARPPAPDGGWGWVVVVCSFLALLLGYGSPQSVGILYPEWLLAFEAGKSMTAWVGSLVIGVGLVVGPICSACVVNFGARPVTVFSGVMVGGGLMLSAFAPNIPFLIFSYGIVVGVGVGLLYSATLTITCLYFEKRRGLALGIVTTGTSLGGFLFATLQSALIELFGLDGCLLIIGALTLNVVACAGPMRPLTPPKYYLKQRAAILERMAKERPLQEDEKPASNVITMETKEQLVTRNSCSAFISVMKIKMRLYSQCLSSTLSVLQDRVLVALCVSLFLFSFGHFPPQLLLEDLAQSSRLTEGVATISLVSLSSIGAGVGKLGLGVMADFPWVNGVLLYALTVGASGLGVLVIPLTSSYLDLQVLSVVLGFLSGNWTLVPYVTSQVVGMEKLAEAYGIVMFFGGVGLMLGPPVAGSFHDFCQSYDVAFYLSGSCMIAGSLALFLTAVLPRGRPPETATPPPESELLGCMVTSATDTASPIAS